MQRLSPSRMRGLVLLVVAAIFTIDLFLPLGVAGAITYVAAVLMTLWIPGRWATWNVAIACSVLTVVDVLVSPPVAPAITVVANRGLALFAIWTVAGLTAQRKEIEAALGESEARARLILHSTAGAILTLDAGGCVTSANAEAERILGGSAADLRGRPLDELLAPFELSPLERRADAGGAAPAAGLVHELTGRRLDGTLFHMEIVVNPVEHDGSTAFTCTVRDITERRRLERALLKANEEERRAIGYGLHEELGQALTGIGLISRQLARAMRASDERHAGELAEISERIHQTDTYARKLFEDLVPVEGDHEGLAEALRRLAADVERTFGVPCRLARADAVTLPDGALATHLYRIARDILHAEAVSRRTRRLTLRLAAGADRLTLSIHIDAAPTTAAGGEDEAAEEALGTARYRASLVGARLAHRHLADGSREVACILPTAAHVG